MKPSRIIVVVVLLLVTAVGFLVYRHAHAPATPVVESSSLDAATTFTYEIAETPAAREQGLSGRADIPSEYGMLFVFDAPTKPGFWMKDMLASIDIIWLDDDGTIVGIEDSVSPDTFPQQFRPSENIRYVLETRAGEARRKGWEVGVKIALPDSLK